MPDTINKPLTQESFRDSISTISKEGKRKWIYPKKPKGKLYNWRTVLSIVLLLIMFAQPFIKINGHPFMLLNVLERKFIIFGIAGIVLMLSIWAFVAILLNVFPLYETHFDRTLIPKAPTF